jgi:hypothetical protein
MTHIILTPEEAAAWDSPDERTWEAVRREVHARARRQAKETRWARCEVYHPDEFLCFTVPAQESE